MTNKKCRGCGANLQLENVLEDGFTLSLENDYCVRCHRLTNYGEFFKSTNTMKNYEEALQEINKTKDLVLVVIDIINIQDNLDHLIKSLNNKMILVINKRDIIPRNIRDERLKERFKEYDFEDILVVSTSRNYQIDELLTSIKKHKTSKRVHVVGNSNVGKSTLINKMLDNYGDRDEVKLTMSPYLSTTVDALEIKLSDDLYFYDTPGFIDMGNILNYVDKSDLKKITITKEIRPKSYQLKPGQSIIIGNFARIDYLEGEKNIFTVYVSNKIPVRRTYSSLNKTLKDLKRVGETTNLEEDIVVSGLGFVKIVYESKIDIYTLENVSIYKRKSLF